MTVPTYDDVEAGRFTKEDSLISRPRYSACKVLSRHSYKGLIDTHNFHVAVTGFELDEIPIPRQILSVFGIVCHLRCQRIRGPLSEVA